MGGCRAGEGGVKEDFSFSSERQLRFRRNANQLEEMGLLKKENTA